MPKKARGYSFERDLDTTLSKTKNIMIKHDTACNNNLFVICEFMREHLGIKVPELTEEQLRQDGVIETILRSVRIIQHDQGVLLPSSPEVRRKRRITDEEWFKWKGVKKDKDRVVV